MCTAIYLTKTGEREVDIRKAVSDQDKVQLQESVARFLAGFANPAFGALPKAEIELLVLRLLQDVGAVPVRPDVYTLVSDLRVTRSKARKLLYEQELRRTNRSELDSRVKDLLADPIIQKSGEQFVLEVDNPLVADHLRAKVRELGHAADGSFSPSLVRLPLAAVVALFDHYIEDQARVRESLVAAGAPDTSLTGVLRAVLVQVGKRAASGAGEELANQTGEFLAPLFESSMETLGSRIAPLFVGRGEAGE